MCQQLVQSRYVILTIQYNNWNINFISVTIENTTYIKFNHISFDF